MNQREAPRAISKSQDIPTAVAEIQQQLGVKDFKLVIFFAAPTYNPQKISEQMYKAFPNSQVVGCSTSGELLGGELFSGSIVAVGLSEDIIKRVSVGLVDDLNDIFKVDSAFQQFEKDYNKPLSEMTEKDYVGLVFADGLSMKTEDLIIRINNLTNIPFIGGTAGDNWEMKNTYLYLEGKAYQNIAILLLLEPTIGYKVFKEESFRPIGDVFKATDVDEKNRCVEKFNNEPAGVFYAKKIDRDVNELPLMDYSLGTIFCNEAYVHDIKCLDANHHMYLYSALKKDAEIQILEATDIIEGTNEKLQKELRGLKSISVIIEFNCGSRCNTLRREGLIDEYKKIFNDLPAVGFSTYGEYFISFVNQTSTMLVLF